MQAVSAAAGCGWGVTASFPRSSLCTQGAEHLWRVTWFPAGGGSVGARGKVGGCAKLGSRGEAHHLLPLAQGARGEMVLLTLVDTLCPERRSRCAPGRSPWRKGHIHCCSSVHMPQRCDAEVGIRHPAGPEEGWHLPAPSPGPHCLTAVQAEAGISLLPAGGPLSSPPFSSPLSAVTRSLPPQCCCPVGGGSPPRWLGARPCYPAPGPA